jgi:hypothetical protein
MTTAMMFWWDVSAATVIAGCHKSSSINAMKVDCMPQSAHTLRLVNAGALLEKRR